MTTEERAQLEAWLSQAQLARHELMIGGKAVSISSGGKTVSYTAGDLVRLDQYIASLKRQLGIEGAVAKPIRVFF